MVRLELMMLYPRGRIDYPYQIPSSLKQDFYFDKDCIDFSMLITQSMRLEFTNDPFDRMIATHAALRESHLITKDRDFLAKSEWRFGKNEY